jgi:hypothetical protein
MFAFDANCLLQFQKAMETISTAREREICLSDSILSHHIKS